MDTILGYNTKKNPVLDGDPNADFFVKATILGWEIGILTEKLKIDKDLTLEKDTIVAFKKFGNGGGVFVCDKQTLQNLTKGTNLSDSIKVNRISVNVMSKCKTVPARYINLIEKPAK